MDKKKLIHQMFFGVGDIYKIKIMNRRIILSESEKGRILSMHKRTINNEHINEALTSPELVLEQPWLTHSTRVSKIADEIQKAMKWVKIGMEDGFVKAICMCKTGDEIFDLERTLERRFNTAGGNTLESTINNALGSGFLGLGNDTKERIQVKNCLNKASQKTFHKDFVTIKNDKIKITW